jgi:hypothetical protein
MVSFLHKSSLNTIVFFFVLINQILQKQLVFSFLRRSSLTFVISLLLFSHAVSAQNPITTENALAGNPSSEWDINGAGDLSIQGFATDISVDQNQTINFKIKSPAAYTITIYRLGWYNGLGARKVSSASSPVVFDAVVPQVQPADQYDAVTGKTSCSNWAVSAHWLVPATAVSGLYIAKLTRNDTSGSSHIAFIVRNDDGNSAFLFKTSDATWQAYNNYGGNSLYVNNSGTAVPGFNHATKVSYDRPFYTRNGGGGGGPSEDWLFNAEYPMIRWMERNGYDVSYTTDVDMDRDASLITPAVHKILLSVGHDEYWSAGARTKFENARNSGVHLAFFSGNEVYWKTRWEDNHRTLVCYKEGTLGENTCGSKCDTSTAVWTGSWRDGNATQYPGSDAGKPENSLTGQISWDGTTAAIQVPDTYKGYHFWRNTSIASLGIGQTATFPDGTLGYEWDWEQYHDFYPPGRVTLSKTTSGSHTHKLSLYRHSSGALVFGAGTVQWSWGLDDKHDRGNEAPSQDMQQATVNLFADMGVQPLTIQSGLTLATVSADVVTPVSIISFPANGASLAANNPITISGTASDATGIVTGVAISVDGGLTWKTASGTTNWTYTWTPLTEGPLTIKSHAFDDSYNIEATGTAPSSNVVDVTITPAVAPICPCTIWNPATIPTNVAEQDSNPVELGVKFRPKFDGYITGIRFYKSTLNTGTHIGNLWNTSGTNLAQATFAAETASGWQQVNFASPVQVTAGTTYIASYHTSTGHYSEDDNFFTSTAVNTYYLEALADGIDGPNGVYAASSISAFPNSSYLSSNYYVDVVFNTSTEPDITPPAVFSVSPTDQALGVTKTIHPSAVFNEAIAPASVTTDSFSMTGPGNATIAGSVSTAAGTVIFTPTASLAYNTTYTLTLKGGYSLPRITDLAGNGLSTDYTWSFTTSDAPPPPPNDGPGGPILVISAAANPFSRYPVEILRAEGLNAFLAMDISAVTTAVLNNYDVVILGEIPLTASQVSLFSDWVNAGGTLIALRPHPLLSPLMGITSAGGSLSDKYLLFNTSSGPGSGLVNQSIQFHGTADYYTLNTATILATLYSNATTATSYPAVTTNSVGPNGGKAIAFTYDLAKSIVYSRQGNPAWAGQERDGENDNIRSSDLFFPDWIDLNKVAIPQADEQQRLLTNIILQSNLHRKPLPRFWFLPRKLKAAVVMTGDDHGSGGTIARFNQYLSYGNNTPADIQDWKAVRGTSYIYTSTPISDAQAASFNTQGFEIALHLNANCTTYNLASLEGYFNSQLPAFTSKYSSLPAPTTNRTHCISWSDWASKPKVELANGIRLNTDYYYWPAAWIQNRPGMFTGSGMPMRFADLDGTIIDNYQLTTQMPDESGISFPGFINTLLDNAIGNLGYYGVFCANMHTDADTSSGSDAIIAAALARNIPVISAKQMLTWLDGRNASSFGSINWSGNDLNFSASVAPGAHKLQAMVPVTSSVGELTGITFNSAPIAYTTEIIKGINYAFFDASTGNYVASYLIDNTPPIITNIVSTPNTDGTTTITWTTNEASSSRIEYGTASTTLNLNSSDGAMVTNHSITLTGLSSSTTYYFRVLSVDNATNSSTVPSAPTALSFIMPTGSCASDTTIADFTAGIMDANNSIIADEGGAVILKPILNEDFSGAGVPSLWIDSVWDGQPGAITTYNAGQLTVNGTHLSYNTPVGPGISLEFTATYTAGNFQNIGFTADPNFNIPWVVIGRGGAGDSNVYVRTSDGQNVSLGSNLLNTAHNYRIQWLANGSFEFYVDGILIATPGITQTITNNMIIHISDYPADAIGLSVDWIRSSPYATSAAFISRVFDAGSVTNWGAVNWNADIPSNTTLSVSVRKGNTASPDGTWSEFIPVSNGGSGTCGASQYIQYKADFATTDNGATAKLKDISITCGSSTDVISPIISTLIVTPNSNGTALFTWTTDESANSVLNYGTVSNNLNLNSNTTALVLNHSLFISGLTPGTIYYYQISSTDCSNNTTTQTIANFTVPAPVTICLQEQQTADFTTGTTGTDTFISSKNGGEIILKPTIAEDFSGAILPNGWQSFNWTSGGTSTVSGGSVTVNGMRLNTVSPTTTFSPGSTMEFVATFGASSFQHIGFAGGTDAIGTGGIYNGESPWAMFSTGNSSSILRARTFSGSGSSLDFDIPGSYLGAPHLYRIVWNANSIEYYVDGILVHSQPITISSAMRPAISDFNTSSPGISVDYMYLSPYPASGTFISGIHDAGIPKTWGTASWTADIAVGTTLQLSQRQSNSNVSILSEPWTLIASNGASIGGTSQYIQYKADFGSSNSTLTPTLKDISISCSTLANTPIVVSTHPVSQTKCEGESVSFTSAASGDPIPTVQWQISIDNGVTWSDIPSATSSTYTFTSNSSNNENQYKAVWTNLNETVVSNSATLTLNTLPTASIGALTNPICQAENISLKLSNATGVSPYTLVVNGTSYTNVNVGDTFATISTVEQSIWGNTGTPVNANVTDNQTIEIGTKFRSTLSGYITGIRFYKGISNTGTHVASLWTTSGTQLATATFIAETASGWQEVRFATPVAIQANTTYIASYLSQGGYFAISTGFFASAGVTNGPLTALQAGTDGVNGVYKYGGGFPDGGNTANYWVDVLFSQVNNTTSFTYDLTSVTDSNGCTNTGTPLNNVTVTTSPTPNGTISASIPSVCDGNPINLTFNSPAGTGPFSLVINGTTYSNVISGTPFATGVATYSPEPATLWNPATIAGLQIVDNAAIELGVKIRSSIPGTISGIRFYKHGTAILNFTGSLWADGNTTTPIATAEYTSDDTPGWKEITFTTPVSINANTSYIASYFSPNSNYYAFSANGLSTPITTGTLTAEESYYKQPGPGYPNTNSTANYWVDLVFNGTSSISNYNLTTITNSQGCSTVVTPAQTASVIVNTNTTSTESVTACDTYTWPANGTAYTATGIYTNTTTNAAGCPNVATLNLTINNSTTSSETVTTCDTYTWPENGTAYTSSGVYTNTTTNAAGCPNVATLNLTINNSTTSSESATACDSYTWAANGQTYTSGGTYTNTTTNAAGCPNVATLNLTINNSTTSSETVTTCDSYTWPANGQTYTSGGTYTNTTTNAAGCPNVATLNLTINNSTTSTESATACDSYTWPANGQTYTIGGTYTNTSTNAAGCPNVATLNLTINNSTSSTESATACDTYTWPENGTAYTASGTYTNTSTNAAGCPNVATLNLTINNSTTSTESATACDSYTWAANGQTYTSGGTYTNTTTNAAGCPNVATLNLTINNSTTSTESVIACDTYTWPENGTAYTTSGIYTNTTTNAAGCDNVATLNLTINNSTTSSESVTACDTYTWTANGTTYTSSGIYTNTTTNAAGCPNVATLNLTINSSTTSTESVTACDTYTWPENSTTYTASGIYTNTTTNAVGCPNVATLNLTINNSTTSSESVTACDTYTWAANGQTYTIGGTYTNSTTNAAGCPNVATLNLTINNSTTSSETVTACDTYTWPANGTAYTASGTYTNTTTNAAGCPNVATLNLTINNSTTSSESVTACDTYTWTENGTAYTASGIYTNTTINAAGCDNVATLNLTINNSTTSTESVTACDTYTWPANGTTYTEGGVYTNTTTNAAGCPNVATINLTFNNSTTSTESVTACDSYTWLANGQTYTTGGTYTNTTTNAAGCENVATLNLTINNSSTTTAESATACDSYTWPANGQTYTTGGTYTNTTTNAAGCPNVATLNLTINNSSTTTAESATACDSYTWPANGQTYTTGGTYTNTTTNAAGCPNVATLNLTINNSTSSTESVTTCDSYTWLANGQTYTMGGTYTNTTTNAAGCPNVATLNLTINNSTSSTESATACDSYTWAANGQTYTIGGTYTNTTTNAAGCPNVVTLNLTINNSSTTTAESVTACDTYTWSANGQTYTTGGTYTNTTTNAAGCPNVATLNLIINNSSTTTVESATACDTYTWAANGQTYTIGGTYTNTTTNAAGCPNVATLNLTINQQPTIPTASVTLQPSCTVTTGTITVTSPTGAGITYSIDGSTYTNTTGIFTSLNPGTYTVTTKNSTACISTGPSLTINNQLTSPVAPIIQSIVQPSSLIPSGSVSLTGLPVGNWTINPGGISGNTQSTTISGLANGTYNFTVTNSTGCISEASADIIIDISLGVPELDVITAKLVVYPNPSRGLVNFLFSTAVDSKVTLELFTINGSLLSRLFYGDVIAGEEHTITYNKSLPSGVYIYRMQSNGGVKLGKLLVN